MENSITGKYEKTIKMGNTSKENEATGTRTGRIIKWQIKQ